MIAEYRHDPDEAGDSCWLRSAPGPAARDARHERAECEARWQPGRRPPEWQNRSSIAGPPDPAPVALEVDHARPLWSLTDAERTEPRWWLPFNLQLLCERCHKAKTRREAAERAAMRAAA